MIKATWVKSYVKIPNQNSFHRDFEYRCNYAERETDGSGFSKEDVCLDVINTCEEKNLKMKPQFTKEVLMTKLEDLSLGKEESKVLVTEYEELNPLPIPHATGTPHLGYLYVGTFGTICRHLKLSPSRFEDYDPRDEKKPCALFVGSLGQWHLFIYQEEYVSEDHLVFLVIKMHKNSFGKVSKRLVTHPFGNPEDVLSFYHDYASKNEVASDVTNVYFRAANYEKELEDPWFQKELSRILKKEGLA